MNKEQKTIFALYAIPLLLVITFSYLIQPAHSDTGKYAAQRIEVGNTLQTRVVALSASAVTTIAAAADNRPDLTCVNTAGGYTIYIGSAAAGTSLTSFGFPVFSSGTFTLGSMSGSVSAIIETGGVGSIRCADGLTQ